MTTNSTTDTTPAPPDIPSHYLTREQVAWTFDNRGSLTVVQKRKRRADGSIHIYYHPRYRAVDKDLSALRLFHNQFGGSLFQHSGRHWSWEIGQEMLADILREVLPYMQEKRRHAELILKLVELKENGGDPAAEREVVEELRRLNGQG